MSTSSLRRALCGAATLALLLCPNAAGAAQTDLSQPATKTGPLSRLSDALQHWLPDAHEELLQWLEDAADEPPDHETKYLIPSGQSIGVAMMCEGVLVVGTGDPGTSQSPARLAGIRSGDWITHVNGKAVVGADAFSRMIASGGEISLTVCRDNRERTVSLQPVPDDGDGAWRIGAWVRDSTAGVGTLTFIDPETGAFGALGHAIQDADTCAMLPVAEGLLFDSRVVGIHRGKAGAPGEIVGSFMENGNAIGDIRCNTACGIFGRCAANYNAADALPIAGSGEVTTGAAQILTTLDDSGPQPYDVEIQRLYDGGSTSRSLMLQVTDPELLARTGGIVQGMSGSPILQNGKLVGAVTHVLVNDPTRGYGIFIENMLEAA